MAKSKESKLLMLRALALLVLIPISVLAKNPDTANQKRCAMSAAKSQARGKLAHEVALDHSGENSSKKKASLKERMAQERINAQLENERNGITPNLTPEALDSLDKTLAYFVNLAKVQMENDFLPGAPFKGDGKQSRSDWIEERRKRANAALDRIEKLEGIKSGNDIKSIGEEVVVGENAFAVEAYNNADKLIRYFVAGEKLSSREVYLISDYIAYYNELLISRSEEVALPAPFYILAGHTGSDAFWSKATHNQAHLVFRYAMTDVRRVFSTRKKHEKRDRNEISWEKHPIRTKPVIFHEYDHVVTDSWLGDVFPRLAANESLARLQRYLSVISGKAAHDYQAVAETLSPELDGLLRELFFAVREGNLSVVEAKSKLQENDITAEKILMLENVMLALEKINSFRPQIIDTAYKILFAESYRPEFKETYSPIIADLKLKAEELENQLEEILQSAYKHVKEGRYQDYEDFKSSMQYFMGSNSTKQRKIAIVGKKSYEILESAESLQKQLVSIVNDIKFYEIKSLKSEEDLLEVAKFFPNMAHQFLSKYHEFLADVGAVLASGNDGKVIFNGLNYTKPNRYRMKLRQKSIDARDFTNKDNSMENFHFEAGGHGFFAPVRYHLWVNYLKQPSNANPEKQVIIYDNVRRAIESELRWAIDGGKFIINYHKIENMSPQETNQRLIDAIEREFKENPLTPNRMDEMKKKMGINSQAS